jgi:carbonic anhydrase
LAESVRSVGVAKWNSYIKNTNNYLAVWVHGWVFHVETGLIEDIMTEHKLPAAM